MTSSTADSNGPPRSAWRDGDFRKLWGAQATGLVGQQFSVLAVPLVAILTLHASASTVGLLVATFNAPWVIFGLFVGVVVDRFSRRSVLIVADVGRAVLLASVPVCALLDVLTIQQLFVIGALVGTLDVCWLTAYRSYIPSVVPRQHLTQAYSLVGASDAVTRTAAPTLAGGVIQILGPPAGLAVTSVTYLGSALLNATIKCRESHLGRADHEPAVRAFREGLAYTWKQHTVRAFAASEATYILFWASMQSILLVFLARTLALTPGRIGLIFSVGTIGGILGAVVAGRIGRRIHRGPAILTGSAMRSAGMLMTPLAAFLGPLAIPALMLARLVNSFGWTVWDVHRETTTQELLSDRFRARANGSVQFVTGSALAIGSAMGAGLVALIGVIPTLLVGGAGTLLALVCLATARIWSLQAPPHQSEPNPAPRATGG